MCDATTAALAISAIGTGASYAGQQRADRERKRATMQGIEAETDAQKKTGLRTTQYLQETLDPTKRAANYETAAADQEANLGSLLADQASAGQGNVNSATAGAVSDTYTRARAQSTADQAVQARNMARLLARAGASGNLFGREAIAGADYSSDLMGIGAESAMSRRRAQNRYGAADNQGRNLQLIGGLLSGASSAVGSRGTTMS